LIELVTLFDINAKYAAAGNFLTSFVTSIYDVIFALPVST